MPSLSPPPQQQVSSYLWNQFELESSSYKQTTEHILTGKASTSVVRDFVRRCERSRSFLSSYVSSSSISARIEALAQEALQSKVKEPSPQGNNSFTFSGSKSAFTDLRPPSLKSRVLSYIGENKTSVATALFGVVVASYLAKKHAPSLIKAMISSL